MVVCELIRSRIEHLDEQRCNATLELSSLEDAQGELDCQPAVDHIHLGSPQKPTTLSTIEQAKSSDPAFRDFRKKFTSFINAFAQAHDIPLPGDSGQFIPNAQDKVRRYSVAQSSPISWLLPTDHRTSIPQGELRVRRGLETGYRLPAMQSKLPR